MEFGHRRSKLFTTLDNANISDCIHCKMSSVTNIIRSVCHRICWHSTRIENVERLLLLCAWHERTLSKVQTAIPLDCKKTSQRMPSCASERTQSKENKTSGTADRRIRKPQPTTHRDEDLEPESIQIPHFLQKLRTRVKLCACQYVCLKCIHHWHYMAQINPLAIQGGKVQGTAYLQRSVLLHELVSCL